MPTIADNADALPLGTFTDDNQHSVQQFGGRKVWARPPATQATEALAAITAAKALSLVCDPVIYIPALHDSDPTWPERCQHTSWYQADGDAPPVWLIFAEASLITICDGTDSAAATWRTHDLTGFTVTSIKAKDGKIVVGTTTGVIVLDYPADSLAAELKYSTSTTPAIVNDSVNAVAITVRKDAPIDLATGLPVLTIPMVTAVGACCINHDGTVTDSALTIAFTGVQATQDGVWFSRAGDVHYATWDDVMAGDGWGDVLASRAAGTQEFDLLAEATNLVLTNDGLALGATTAQFDAKVGLMLHKPDYANPEKGMSALITSEYNTGWMVGDVKGCLLCDTDATDLTGGEKIANHDFATGDTTGWTVPSIWANGTGDGSVDFSVPGQVTITEQGGSDRYFSQQLTGVLSGETVTGFITLSANTATGAGLRVVVAAAAGSSFPYASLIGAGTIEFSIVATTNDPWLTIFVSGTDATATITSVSIPNIHPDRSVNNSGLAVSGTVAAALDAGTDLAWFTPDTDCTCELATDISSSGMVTWWEKVSGVPHLYMLDLSGSQDFVDGAAGTAPTTSITVVGTTLTVKAGKTVKLVRPSATLTSAQQAAEQYAAELSMIRGYATLSGSADDVTSLAFDEQKNELLAGQPDALNVFGGPSLFSRIDESAEAVTALAACDGYRYVEN